MTTKKKKTYTPKSPARRAKGAVVGIGLHLVAVAIFAAMMAINLSHLLSRNPDEPLSDASLVPGFETYALAYGLAAIGQIATLIVYGVLFFMWVHRTNRNAQTLSTGMEVSPGWAVGWFFIPFASLYKPFQGLDQTWRVSIDPTRWRAVDTPVLLRVWWGLYLASNVTGWLSNMAGGARTVGSHAAAAMVGLASSGLLILCCLAAIQMVRTLTRQQINALEVSAFA